MQRVDSPSRSYPTLSSMPHIRAELTPAQIAMRYPTVGVHVPDREAPGGVLQYTITPVLNEDLTYSYALYTDGQRVVDPQRLFRDYPGHREIVDQHLGHLPYGFVKRIYHDLGADAQLQPAVYAQTLPKGATPPPQHYVTHTPVIREVIPHEHVTPRLKEERQLPSLSMGEIMDQALEQIRLRVAAGTLPVTALDDNSGYYTSIVDNVNHQVHQIGYSSRKRLPWHVVFQLYDDIDPVHGTYVVPTPRVVGGDVMFATSHSPFMREVYRKRYDPNDDVAKLVTKDALGFLNESTRRYIHGNSVKTPAVVPPPPKNVIQFDPNQPNWLRLFLQNRGRDLPQRPLPPVADDSIPRARRLRLVKPGELGWRASELVDTNQLPEWVKEASGPLERIKEPRAEELGWDSRGMPKPLRVSRPLYDDSGPKHRQYPLLPLPQDMHIPLMYVGRRPDQTVVFGTSRIHSNYSFI